jgi:type II secretory ATPase GspE/PulE/Tfp pilus assembly ATPase PilB-like protein
MYAANDFEASTANLAPQQAVAKLIEHAADLGASDLFFTTNEGHVAVSVRHLGIYRRVTLLPLDLGRRCQAHVKAVASLDIAEHRRPLDGRWIHQRDGADAVDLRVNVLPTLFGEDLTLRLLRRKSSLLDLENLGLLHKDLARLRELLRSPSGMLLVTGPTVSGKTTTLYACLSHLNNGRRKINTIEDPIEYALEGIRQSQVNLPIDLDFPELLRSVLRQAPDVIMIGEVRDAVTAETAVRAANSGHLVLATLHAPTAAAAIQSLLSFGVLPNFLATSLRGVVAQRLVRTLCRACKVPEPPGEAHPDVAEALRWLGPEEGQGVLHAATGCPKCHQTGYAARTGVFEVLVASPELRKLIVQRRPTAEVHRQAVEEGMVEMRHAARYKIAQGLTTQEEVLRVIPSEYLVLEE